MSFQCTIPWRAQSLLSVLFSFTPVSPLTLSDILTQSLTPEPPLHRDVTITPWLTPTHQSHCNSAVTTKPALFQPPLLLHYFVCSLRLTSKMLRCVLCSFFCSWDLNSTERKDHTEGKRISGCEVVPGTAGWVVLQHPVHFWNVNATGHHICAHQNAPRKKEKCIFINLSFEKSQPPHSCVLCTFTGEWGTKHFKTFGVF